MVVEKGYKATEIGVIPSDWELKTLGEVGEVIVGLTYSPNDVKEYGTLVLRSSNIQDNKLAYQNNVFVEMDLPDRVIVREGDLLICVRNGSRNLIGKSALIDKNASGAAFGAFMSIYRSTINNYISKIFQDKIIQKQIENNLGATINQITNKDLKSFKVPLPQTENEQTAIANALSDMDALIAQTEKLIEKKKAIKQGVMQELLRPKEGWVTKKFTDVVEYIHGKAHEQYIVDDGKYKVVNSKFISTDGEIVKYSNVSFLTAKKDDILTVLSDLPNGKALAKCFLVDQDNLYAVNQRVCIWRSKGANPLFLFYLLNRHKYFLQLDDGVTQTHILNGDINRFEITITEDVESQKEIGIIIHDIDKKISQLEKKSLKLKLQKQGMMQALLTGKIRLA